MTIERFYLVLAAGVTTLVATHAPYVPFAVLTFWPERFDFLRDSMKLRSNFDC